MLNVGVGVPGMIIFGGVTNCELLIGWVGEVEEGGRMETGWLVPFTWQLDEIRLNTIKEIPAIFIISHLLNKIIQS